MHDYVKNLAKVVRAAREEAHLSQAALAEQIGCDERTILNIENDRGNPKFEVLCQIIAYLHIPADRIFHPDTATDGLKKQKLLLMLQECDEQEAAEIPVFLPGESQGRGSLVGCRLWGLHRVGHD